jgi:hypothetical protein
VYPASARIVDPVRYEDWSVGQVLLDRRGADGERRVVDEDVDVPGRGRAHRLVVFRSRRTNRAAPPGCGTGIGLAMPTITALSTSDLPKNETAAGSAVVQMSRQLGSVLGNAVLIAVLGSAAATGAASQFIHAGRVTFGAYAASMLISRTAWRRSADGSSSRVRRGQVPSVLRAEFPI